MSPDRYVLLGLARVHSVWFGEVSRWATSAMIPADFIKCVSVDDVRARLSSGRAFSALLLDGDAIGADRDLLDSARAAGCAVVVIHDGRSGRDWVSLGASAVLDSTFERGDLLAVLDSHATAIGRAEILPDPTDVGAVAAGATAATLVAVTGPGGTGASTIAMALAQGLGADPTNRHLVLLADLALDADLAMLHDARDIVPGVQELVESFRAGSPTGRELRSLVFDDATRGHHLLLGLRRHRDWTALRPRALEAAMDGLRSTYRYLIADVDPDLEGADETGAVEVEERNLLARTTVPRADLVAVVGAPGMKGLHSIVRTITNLFDHGVEPGRILPIVNRAPRSPRLRAELVSTLSELLADPRRPGSPVNPPVFVPERRRVDDLHRDADRLPDQLVRPVTAAVLAAMERTGGPFAAPVPEPVAIAPGSLGSLFDGEIAS